MITALCCAALFVVAVLIFPAVAHAYIDPGTTGMVVGGVAGVLAWGLLIVAILRRKIVALFKFLFRIFVQRPIISSAIVLGLAGGGFTAWSNMGEEEVVIPERVTGSKFDRVVLLGIDGVDPDDVKTLMDQGLLPNFQRVATAGSFKRLTIPNSAQSPVVWSSLATGQNPGRHGIFDFIGRDPSNYIPRLAVLSQGVGGGYQYPLKAKAFWDVTTQSKIPTTVVRWPLTFPPERVHGKVLAGLGVPDLRGGLGSYSFFTDQEVAADADGADKVVKVEVKGAQIETQLVGPRSRSLTGTKDLTLPLTIRLGGDGKSAVATIGKQNFVLTQGQWSDWADLTFSSGLFGKYRGLIKFHLQSTKEPFALYATAVEMHPDAPVANFTYPPNYAAEMRKKIGLFHTLGMPEDTKAYGNGHLSEQAFFEMCRSVEAERRAMLMMELEQFQSGLLAVVFDTSDRIQHMTPKGDDPATTAIGKYLIEFDRFLGGVLGKLPANTPLILFSDHGFSAFDKSVDLNRWLVANGYMTLDEEAYKQRLVDDNGELFKYVQWDKTQAYAVGFATLYINVAGREGKGVVAEADKARVATEIASKLSALKDPEGDQPVVHKVYQREDLYNGEETVNGPDLVVGYQPGYRGAWQAAIGGVSPEVFAVNDKLWQRDHIVDSSFVEASLITNFEVSSDHPHAFDLAPTILSLLGLVPPSQMEGSSWFKGGGDTVARVAD